MRILAIETSCDESAVAVLDERRGLLAHELWSQVDLHRAFGGVVPELASRDHVRRLVPLLRTALERADTRAAQIDGVAYTAGPGLVGALLTGAALARSLSFGWGVPAIGVHHLEGHLLAPMLETPSPPFPHVALLVSGGHTMLIEVRGIGDYRILGQTRDDAAGEAFDKTAKLLGLPYPGGPELAQLAAEGRPGAYLFPRPMLDRPGFEFSFSGLKTAVMQAVRAAPLNDQGRADVAYAVQDAIVATLCAKALRALSFTGGNHGGALEILERLGDVGRGRNLGAIRALGGNEAGERAVGFLQVGFGHAQDVGFGDGLDAVAHEEHETPIALREILAEIERDGLRIVHLELDIFQHAGLDALPLFLPGGFGGQAFDGLEQDLARFVERLVHLQADGGDEEAGVVEFLHFHGGADSLLVIHEGLVEAARGVVAENAGEDLKRGGVGVGSGGDVIDGHETLRIADAAEGDGALAILGGFDGVGLLEGA